MGARRRTMMDLPKTEAQVYETLTLDRPKKSILKKVHHEKAQKSNSNPLILGTGNITATTARSKVSRTQSSRKSGPDSDENAKEIEDFENFSKSVLAKINIHDKRPIGIRPKKPSLDSGLSGMSTTPSYETRSKTLSRVSKKLSVQSDKKRGHREQLV